MFLFSFSFLWWQRVSHLIKCDILIIYFPNEGSTVWRQGRSFTLRPLVAAALPRCLYSVQEPWLACCLHSNLSWVLSFFSSKSSQQPPRHCYKVRVKVEIFRKLKLFEDASQNIVYMAEDLDTAEDSGGVPRHDVRQWDGGVGGDGHHHATQKQPDTENIFSPASISAATWWLWTGHYLATTLWCL